MASGDHPLGVADAIAYTALFGFTLKILTVENKDLRCPYLQASEEECRARGGMPFADTSPEPGDSAKTLRQKVDKALKHESAAIKWRRSLVLSVFINLGLTALVYRKIPPWWKFYTGVIVTYFVIFGYFNYYSFHISNEAEKNGRASLKEMYQKLSQHQW